MGIFLRVSQKCSEQNYVKHIRIRSYFGPYFPEFGLNTDQNNSEYEHFSGSATNG